MGICIDTLLSQCAHTIEGHTGLTQNQVLEIAWFAQ